MSPRRTPAQGRELVAAFRRSGLSQRDFAEREGVKLTTLQAWIYRPTRLASQAEPVPRFVRVEGEAAGGVRIQVGGEVVVYLAALPDPEYVVRLVRALAC